MFQMFEYLRVVRTVTSKFRFFTLENGQKSHFFSRQIHSFKTANFHIVYVTFLQSQDLFPQCALQYLQPDLNSYEFKL